MPNVRLTERMRAHIDGQIQSGAYANVSEVVRAGVRMLMQNEGARQFYALKANLELAMSEAEAGDCEPFDPQLYEPDAGRVNHRA